MEPDDYGLNLILDVHVDYVGLARYYFMELPNPGPKFCPMRIPTLVRSTFACGTSLVLQWNSRPDGTQIPSQPS